MGQTKHPHVDAQNCGNGKKIDSNNQEQKHAFCFPTKKCSGECANNFNFLDWGAARLDPICKSPKVRSTSAHTNTYECLCLCLSEQRPRVCHFASIAGLGHTIFYDEFTTSLNWLFRVENYWGRYIRPGIYLAYVMKYGDLMTV